MNRATVGEGPPAALRYEYSYAVVARSHQTRLAGAATDSNSVGCGAGCPRTKKKKNRAEIPQSIRQSNCRTHADAVDNGRHTRSRLPSSPPLGLVTNNKYEERTKEGCDRWSR